MAGAWEERREELEIKLRGFRGDCIGKSVMSQVLY